MNWSEFFEDEKKKSYYVKLNKNLLQEYKNKTIYPKYENIFLAFELCEFNSINVVILGQDPYHQQNQAMGLSFSTPKDIKNPPSLENIFKEIKSDTNTSSTCIHGDLTSWTKQGVLLINTVLSVEDSRPNSHKDIGWESFSINAIECISQNRQNVVFLLWGNYAQKFTKYIDKSKHHILTSSHPSPLSSYRGFLGCKHFSKTNEILKSLDKKPIIW